MFENYMDYSNDACLNTFTTDQTNRIQTVLLNSPRRKELVASKACQARPGNAVQFTMLKSQQIETGTTGTCPLTKTFTVGIAVSVQASGTATLTFATAGTASNGADYTISPASVNFTAGDNTSKTVTITVIDDRAIEATETIELSYAIAGSGVVAGPDKQMQTIALTDNDFERTLNDVPIVLLNQDFNAAAGTPAGWFIQNGFANGWEISANGGTGTTGNALHISEDPALKPNTYNETSESEAFAVTPLIDASGLTNVSFSFKWRCAGELNFDEGSIGYILESNPGTVNFFNPVFNNKPGAATTSNFILPASLNNSRFFLVFYWYNDDSDGIDPGFTVDDVLVTGQAVSVESTANDAATAPQYSGQTVQYITPDNQIIARVAAINENVGCITATLQNAGAGRTSIQTAAGSYFRTNKVVRIAPLAANTTATYQVTVYFTAAELSPAWTAGEIPGLRVLKVKDGVNLGGLITTADAQLATTAFADNTASGGYYSYTASFTGGFSQFMLVSPGLTLPVNLLTFEAQPGKKNIGLTWKTSAEKSNKGFYVERSSNGSDFSTIGWVKGRGTTVETSSYQYTDNFVQPATVYYYRLKQVDADNRSTLSSIRQAKILAADISVTISPNPARDNLNVFVTGSTQPADLSLVNASGQVVAKWTKADLRAPYSIYLNGFARGHYTLIIHLPDGDVRNQILLQ